VLVDLVEGMDWEWIGLIFNIDKDEVVGEYIDRRITTGYGWIDACKRMDEWVVLTNRLSIPKEIPNRGMRVKLIIARAQTR
jgi:hypothetical protein